MKNERFTDIAVLVLRVVVGVIFAAHGAQKVLGVFGGGGIEAFAGVMQNFGMTPPVIWAWVVGGGELIFGVLLVLGIIPRLSAAFIGITMIGAIALVHGQAGFFAKQGGFEYQLLIIACCVSIIMTGSGKFSLFDRF